MKTKVQAQRKFAQGAFIPPTINISNVSIDRRIDVSPNKEKNIFHNSTSAKSLLDIVSFKNLHKHAQPIVLLERLEDQQTLGSKDNGPSAITIANKPSTVNSTINKSHDEPKQANSFSPRVAAARQNKNNKTRIITPRLPMHLRSRIIVYNDSNKALAYKKKNSIKDRKKVIVSSRKLRRKKRPLRVTGEVSNDDDDKPLTFFRNKKLRTRKNQSVNKNKTKRKRPHSVKYSEPSIKIRERFVRRLLEVPGPIPGKTFSNVYQNLVPETSSTYVDPIPDTSKSSTLYQEPVPATSSSYEDHAPKTSSSDIYKNPVPDTSSSSNKDPVPSSSTSSIYQDPVPGTSSSFYQDPVPGTSSPVHDNPIPGPLQLYLKDPSISICSSIKDDLEQEATIDFGEVDEFYENMDYENEKPKAELFVNIAFVGPFTEIETILLKRPPFYGIKEIDTWVSSNMIFIPPVPQVSTRKSSRKLGDQIMYPEIDLDICIGSKLKSMEAILEYGPSFYDCLCLNCSDCKHIHTLLSSYKQNSLETMTEEENLRRQNEEAAAAATAAAAAAAACENTLNMVISNVRSEQSVIESITIDLTEDSNDVNSINELPIQNSVQPNIPVQNVQNAMPAQNVEQPEIPVQNVEQPEMPEQNIVQHEMPENGESETDDQLIAVRSTPARVREPQRRRRKRVRVRSTGGPMTRQKTKAAANAKTKKKKNDTNDVTDPVLPTILKGAKLINAPVFYPTLKEFKDPMVYLEKVMPSATKFGLFKVVSPSSFKPPCTMGDNARFTVSNQYIARLFSRWGPAAREMCTIRAYLASQKVFFSRPPLLDGLEVNLPKLFHTVQRLGGLKAVFNKKKWTRVAEEMKIKTIPNPEKKFDLLCLKYLLPYDTLTKRERQDIMMHVEQEWCKKSAKMLGRVENPLHQQKRLLGDSDPSDDEQDEDDLYAQALVESEDCVVRGRNMCLGTFKKIADTALRMYFPPGDPPPTTAAVEDLYWNIVLLGTDHVSINAAFIDCGPEGYGFPKNKNAPYGKHPWNLKMLSSNHRNVLHFLGSVSGVTVPSLHIGMVFSTSCWHRDPHGLPWIEYMHQGCDKIWYGVPEAQSTNFRAAAKTLCPTSCQHKPIWLSSDIAMIPPNLLLDQNVRLSRVVQKPGEFVVVMPRAYSCSISTGFTISESVYFATNSFLQKVYPVFQELRESCEPSIFALEQLLISMSKDPSTPLYLLHQVHGYLKTIVRQELIYRNALADLKVPLLHVKRGVESWNLRDEEECQVCRTALYLSHVEGVFGKDSKLCQQHALRVLNDRKEAGKLDLAGIKLEVSMTGDELDEIIHNLQKQLLPK